MSAHPEESLPGHASNIGQAKAAEVELTLGEALAYLEQLPADLTVRLTVRAAGDGQEIEVIAPAPVGWHLGRMPARENRGKGSIL